jgi:hypothetical protein
MKNLLSLDHINYNVRLMEKHKIRELQNELEVLRFKLKLHRKACNDIVKAILDIENKIELLSINQLEINFDETGQDMDHN